MNTNSKEFFINLKPREIPFWNPLYGFEEQDDDVKQFWDNEANKLINGVTINGVFIHPWLYWHLNFWNMMLDKGEDRVPGLSELRDNEWLFAEILQQAEQENKGVFMFGTRRFGKALLDSEIVYCEDHEKKIGDISVGDYIYDDSGHLTEVTGVYPQGKVMTYRVTFEDGRNAICCGEHLWKVKTGGKWTVKKLKEISMLDYKSMSIPICKPIDYPNSKLPIPASAYGSMLASYLTGYIDDVPYDYRISRSFLRSSIKQKETFINSFIKSLNGVVTGNEEFVINTGDMNIIKFVLRMFWSSGWYSKLDGNKLILSNTLDSVKISSIDVYGKYTATCITVNNESKLFLTTNYIVTHNTAIMSSFLARNATMTYNLTHNVIGGSKEDLMSLSEYLEFGLDNIHPYLKINRTGNDWFKEVIMGVKNVRNERDVHARIRITNIDQGKTSSSLKTAGGTPYTSIYDEVGKFPFLSAYLAGKPAHMMKGRMRGMILAAGCVCAGSIVYKANGDPCKIEDLKQEDGIIGYNTTARKRKKQNINWMKEPSDKYCVKIYAEYLCKHISIECSYDHPFYSFNPKGRDRIYTNYVPAILLRNGDEVGYVDGSGNLKKAVVSCINYIGFKTVYNLSADGFNNYIANGFLTHNTGGNVDRSQDAQKVMNDPSSYDFVVMNYDLLNKRAITPTWRICKSGCFVPGQMSHAYEKKKETLDEYLGIKNAPGLRKISIYVTDFEKNTELIKQKREELSKKDKELFVNEKMAYPLTIDDCFLNTNVNRFPVEDALIHKSRLLEEGRPGKIVDIYKIGSNKIGWNFSEKQLAPYPFKGGNIDAPVVIYEDPPEEGGKFDYTYVSGCLLPGEKVLTKRGLVNVEEVGFNDNLINKDGEYVNINALLRYNKVDEDIYEIRTGNKLSTTTFTGEHPIYVSDQIKRNSIIREDLFNFDFINVSEVKVGQWIKYPNIYTKEFLNDSDIYPFYHSEEFWWVIGFWLGNGYVSYDKMHTILYIDEKDIDSIDRMKIISNDIFGVNYYYRRRKGCVEITIPNKVLSIWIKNNFGRYSYGKKIPEFVKYLPKKYKTALCLGYLDSDGCITRHPKGYYSTEYMSVNLGLLESIQDILTSLGIIGNITIASKKKKSFIVNRYSETREKYHLRIGDTGTLMFKRLVDDYIPFHSRKINKIGKSILRYDMHRRNCFISEDGRYIYYRIMEIKKRKYTGIVYNFDCETHTYLCHHITTHNCDPFKNEKADTESLGAFYILKRLVHINDPFAYKIAASYVSRPPKSDDFCRTCEDLIEAYGAKCLMENADRIFELYLARRHKEMILLEDGEQLANRIIKQGVRQNNKLGLSPTVQNQRMLFSAVLQYCWEEIIVGYDEDGNEIKQKGIYRIDDIELLDEIIAFGPGVNTDRIIAFGHALLLARYYDDMNFMPESPVKKYNEAVRKKRKIEQYKGFVLRRHNPFKMR